MSDGLQREARRVAAGGESVLAQLRRRLRRIVEPHHEAARLFLGADGRPSEAAAPWLERIERENFVRSTTFSAGGIEATLINEGRRQLALEILGSVRLDVAELDRINAQIREIEDGGQ